MCYVAVKQASAGIDNSVRVLNERSRESFAQYIAHHSISLKKIHYEGFKGRVLFHTHYNEYFKENVHMSDTCDSLVETTQHIPPKGIQLIRRYGLNSSRAKSMPHVAERVPASWRRRHYSKTLPSTPDGFGPSDDAALPDDSPDARVYRRA